MAKHKRTKDGPAICPMLPQLFKYMETYIQLIRPLYASSDKDALFINKEGIIGHRLASFIGKCGVMLGKAYGIRRYEKAYHN